MLLNNFLWYLGIGCIVVLSPLGRYFCDTTRHVTVSAASAPHNPVRPSYFRITDSRAARVCWRVSDSCRPRCEDGGTRIHISSYFIPPKQQNLFNNIQHFIFPEQFPSILESPVRFTLTVVKYPLDAVQEGTRWFTVSIPRQRRCSGTSQNTIYPWIIYDLKKSISRVDKYFPSAKILLDASQEYSNLVKSHNLPVETKNTNLKFSEIEHWFTGEKENSETSTFAI